jgi:hypothetical protein
MATKRIEYDNEPDVGYNRIDYDDKPDVDYNRIDYDDESDVNYNRIDYDDEPDVVDSGELAIIPEEEQEMNLQIRPVNAGRTSVNRLSTSTIT